jgi:Uma2 family endonuclease
VYICIEKTFDSLRGLKVRKNYTMSAQVKTTEIEIKNRRTYTNAEFEVSSEFEDHYELLAGKVTAKMPSDAHGRIAENIADALTVFGAKKFGRKWRDTSFDLAEGWMPVPDLAFVITAKIPPISKKAVKVVPDLVVEIDSPGYLDTQAGRDAAANKIKKYQEAGVRIIWTVNPCSKTVKVHYANQAEPVRTLTVEDELEGEDILPGFKLKIAELFS